MAADKWLEDELAELDEAELLIQQAMSDFLPNSKNTSEGKDSIENVGVATADTGQPSSDYPDLWEMPKHYCPVVTTSTIPKIQRDVEKSTVGGSNDNFDLPPPPDLDDLAVTKVKDSSTKQSDLSPPPPSVINSKPQPPKDSKASTMSKAAPPPVLPKPSRSTALKAKSANQGDSQKASGKIPSLDTGATAVPPPASSIPKNIEKNSVDELDFLTSNLLSNMEHYKEEDFYGYCEKCGSVVEGEKVGCNALGGVYHIKCFTCVTCGKELHGEPFYAVDKTIYCENCYMTSLEKCTACSENITDKILRATGKPFHPDCFRCCECKKSLDGISFIVDDSDRIYCVEGYHKKYAPKCSVCDLLILPEPGKEESTRVVALDRNFHITCYKCEKCDVQFSPDKGCYPIDGHIYCQECNGKVQQEQAAAAS